MRTGAGGLGLSPSSPGNGPLNPGVTGGTAAADGRFRGQSPGSGPPPFVSEAGPGSPMSNTPGSAPGEALGPSMSSNEPLSGAETLGVGLPGGLSPTPSSGSGPAPIPIGGTGTGGSVSRPSGAVLGPRRPGRQNRKPPKKLSRESAAAIGLGVASGAFALSALAAGIASAVQERRRVAHAAAAGTAAPGRRPGCNPKPCGANCGGRKRRSIPMSKVSADVLDSISVNLDHLY